MREAGLCQSRNFHQHDITACTFATMPPTLHARLVTAKTVVPAIFARCFLNFKIRAFLRAPAWVFALNFSVRNIASFHPHKEISLHFLSITRRIAPTSVVKSSFSISQQCACDCWFFLLFINIALQVFSLKPSFGTCSQVGKGLIFQIRSSPSKITFSCASHANNSEGKFCKAMIFLPQLERFRS